MERHNPSTIAFTAALVFQACSTDLTLLGESIRKVNDQKPGASIPESIATDCTFTALFVGTEFIARITGALVTAQSVNTALLTASIVRFGTFIFLCQDREE